MKYRSHRKKKKNLKIWTTTPKRGEIEILALTEIDVSITSFCNAIDIKFKVKWRKNKHTVNKYIFLYGSTSKLLS